MKNINLRFLAVVLAGFVFAGCKKDALDIKSDQGMLVPRSLSDMEALLDNTQAMNQHVGLQLLAGDEFELTRAGLNSFGTVPERNAYIWKPDLYEGTTSGDWNQCYQQVFYANVVLDGLAQLSEGDASSPRGRQLRGSALFFRANAFFQLAMLFCPAYEQSSADAQPGVPLKLSSDINVRPGRVNLAEVFERVVADLEQAATLLPARQEKYLNRPSAVAVYAMLARTRLYMGEYDQALVWANKALGLQNTLMDYNTLSASSNRPFVFSVSGSTEVILWQFMIGYSFNASLATNVSPALMGMYEGNDLRRTVFFRNRGAGVNTFKGSYSGDSYFFQGLATDELYLIVAECEARVGNMQLAADAMGILRKKRWKSGTVPPILAVDRKLALQEIVLERKKELVARGLRWYDLKRTNLDPALRVTLRRNMGSESYELLPNSNLYVFPIPDNEIAGSGIAQNPR